MAALASPAPSSFKSTASAVNGVTRASMNASGLAIYPNGTNPLHEPGLSVNDGNGLRIFGLDEKTTGSGATEAWSANRLGTLEVYGHSGDFLFNYDGKMVLNDKLTASEGLAKPNAFSVFSRTTDYTIPMVVASYNTTYWATANGMYVPATTTATTAIANANTALNAVYDLTYDQTGTTGDIHNGMVDVMGYCITALTQLNYFLTTLGVAQAHVSSCGTVMAVDNNENSQNVTRHYAASAS